MSYPDHMAIRRVRTSGEIKWKGRLMYLSEALTGEPVGLERETERHWRIYFGPLRLCLLDDHDNSIIRNASEWTAEVSPMSPV